MKNIDELSAKEIDKDWSLISRLVTLVTHFWDIKAEPKDFQKHLETFDADSYDYDEEEYKEMVSKIEENEIPIDTYSSHSGMPFNLSKNDIAYSFKEQGRSTIQMLFASIWFHGNTYGARKQELESKEKIERLEKNTKFELEFNTTLFNENIDLESKYFQALQKIKEMSDFDDVVFGNEDISVSTELEKLELKRKKRVGAVDEISDMLKGLDID